MLRLEELQNAFGRAVQTGDFAGLAPHVAPDGMRVASRIGVYRNNVVTSLVGMLAERFPVVVELVDARFFGYAAEQFLAQFPPDAPCLDLYGAGFAGFLEQFPACAALPYLGDVARLEWALFEVARAEFAPGGGVDWAGIGTGAAMGLRLNFYGAAYLESPWPVAAIWRGQGDGVGGCRLEIARRGGDLAIRELGEAEFVFRRALCGGAVLAEALEWALACDEDFDFGSVLVDLISDPIVGSPLH